LAKDYYQERIKNFLSHTRIWFLCAGLGSSAHFCFAALPTGKRKNETRKRKNRKKEKIPWYPKKKKRKINKKKKVRKKVAYSPSFLFS
jgi:hypothetical protein